MDFIAIDIETSHSTQRMPCYIDMVKVVDGEIAESFGEYIAPPQMLFDSICSEYHGITAETVDGKPSFKKLWRGISRFIGDYPLVSWMGDCTNRAYWDNAINYYKISTHWKLWVDIMEMGWVLFDENLSMTQLSEKFQLEYLPHQRHEAETIAKIALKCRCEMGDNFFKRFFACPDLRAMKIEYSKNVRWDFPATLHMPNGLLHTEQAVSLRRYWGEKIANFDQRFLGKSFAFSGSFEFFTQKELEEFVTYFGGKLQPPYDFLVIGKDREDAIRAGGYVSSKCQRIMEQEGIKIVTRDDFLRNLQ